MPEIMILSLIVAVFVGGASAFLGTLMVTRKMALVGDALGHVALPGMGLAFLLGVDPGLGAFVFLAAGIFVVWRLGARSLLSTETAVGVVFVSSLALGFLIVPQPELLETLIGDISKVNWPGAAVSVAVSIFVMWIGKRLYPKLMLANLSEELAEVEGINVKKINLSFLLLIALIVAVGIKVTGSLLVGALVILPPATARLVSQRVKQYAAVSVFLGAASGLLGIVLGRMLRFPAGPAIILVNTFFFAAAFLIRRVEPRLRY